VSGTLVNVVGIRGVISDLRREYFMFTRADIVINAPPIPPPKMGSTQAGSSMLLSLPLAFDDSSESSLAKSMLSVVTWLSTLTTFAFDMTSCTFATATLTFDGAPTYL
jgi:hypothetical protein